MPLPLFFGGGVGKIFGLAFKSNVQKGLKSQKSCLYLKWYGSYWNVNFYHIRLKRGHAFPLFWGGIEKFLVRLFLDNMYGWPERESRLDFFRFLGSHRPPKKFLLIEFRIRIHETGLLIEIELALKWKYMNGLKMHIRYITLILTFN